VFELHRELLRFLGKKKLDLAKLFEDKDRVAKLAYLSDFFPF
jgi:hypothetical protein